MSLLDHLWNNGFIAEGDLEGDGMSQTVVGLRGNPINVGTPEVGQALVWNGTSWVYEDWVAPVIPPGAANTVYFCDGAEADWSAIPTLSTLKLLGDSTNPTLEIPDGQIGIALNVGGTKRTILERRATAGQLDFGHTSYALKLVTNGTVYVPPVVQFSGTGVRYLTSAETTNIAADDTIIAGQSSSHEDGAGGDLTLQGGDGPSDSGSVILCVGASERMRTTGFGSSFTGRVMSQEDEYGIALRVIDHVTHAAVSSFNVDLILSAYDLDGCGAFDVRWRIVSMVGPGSSGSGSMDCAAAYQHNPGVSLTLSTSPQLPTDVTNGHRIFYATPVTPTEVGNSVLRLTIEQTWPMSTKWIVLWDIVGVKIY